MIREFFVVKDVTTDKYLPEVFPKRLSGRTSYTHHEPMYAHEAQPRLFPTRVAANRALGQWLGGSVHKESYQDSDGDWNESVTRKKIPTRVRANMVVIPAYLECM